MLSRLWQSLKTQVVVMAVVLMVLCCTSSLITMAEAQFLTPEEVDDTICALNSNRYDGQFDLYAKNITVEYRAVQEKAVLGVFAGSTKYRWALDCLLVEDRPPEDLPSYLADTCRSEGNRLYFCHEYFKEEWIATGVLKTTPAWSCVDISRYENDPVQQLQFSGPGSPQIMQKNLSVDVASYSIQWLPMRTYGSSACYPRSVSAVFTAGLMKPEDQPPIAYIIIGIIAGVMGVVVICVFGYLLYRRMNRFSARGEHLGEQKNPAEPYGPGDEHPAAIARRSEEEHLEAHRNPDGPYAITEEVEVEPGVFVSRRVALYAPNQSYQQQLEDAASHTINNYRHNDTAGGGQGGINGNGPFEGPAARHNRPTSPDADGDGDDGGGYSYQFNRPANALPPTVIASPSPHASADNGSDGGDYNYQYSGVGRASPIVAPPPHRPEATADPFQDRVGGGYYAAPAQPTAVHPHTATLVPSTINGAPSANVYGHGYADVLPFANRGGPQTAVIEAPIGGGSGAANGSSLYNPAVDEVEMVPVQIVSVPLRRPWYEQVSADYREAQQSASGGRGAIEATNRNLYPMNGNMSSSIRTTAINNSLYTAVPVSQYGR